ncbi:uncharacterized protein LOC123199825 [Mangifera indica]|uniref:uncharacterized protein LOC123199825 n=1 Tax=Mangifera indica TaxID=29780 RepID=UPI001CF9DBA5|nr:uncharacterized protein LOC123199825 [Mangifera indica]
MLNRQNINDLPSIYRSVSQFAFCKIASYTKMNHAIRSVRANPPSVLSSLKASVVKVRQVITQSRLPENPSSLDSSQNQINPNNPQEKTGDVMSHSFGEGYATRSDEDGFGGIYGGNQSVPKIEIDKEIHENHPAYDKTQGSDVAEKEKGRHQTDASS